MASNYPPGVTGNEPQITGVWPVEVVIQNAIDSLTDAKAKVIYSVSDAIAACEDQGISFNKIEIEHQEKCFAAIEAAFENTIEDIESRMPDDSSVY